MTKKLLNIVAISVAFFMGISINNSCADSDDYRPHREDVSIEELWAVVNNLKAEVDSLTLKVKELENVKSDVESGEFFVDGLWFSRDGYCISPLLSLTSWKNVYLKENNAIFNRHKIHINHLVNLLCSNKEYTNI